MSSENAKKRLDPRFRGDERKWGRGLLLCLLLAAAPAYAAPTPAELNKVEADQREREQERDVARAQSQDAAKAVADLQRQLVDLAAAQTKGEREVKGKRETLAQLNLRETALTAKMGDNRHQLARLLGALELFKRDPPPALFVHPRDAKAAVRAAILIRALEPELERRAKAFRSEAEEIKRLRREAAGASAELFSAESDVADRRAKIEALIAQKTALQRQAAADALIADRDVQALAARAKSLRELLAGLPAAEAPLILGEAPPPNPETSGLFGGAKAFVQPVEGELVRRFGEAQPDRARGQGKSLGWTWRAEKGAQVLAPAAGVVEYAGPLK